MILIRSSKSTKEILYERRTSGASLTYLESSPECRMRSHERTYGRGEIGELGVNNMVIDGLDLTEELNVPSSILKSVNNTLLKIYFGIFIAR